MAISTVEPYNERFMRLKEERGLSWTQLVAASDNKVSLGTLRAFGMGWRYPSMEQIADVSKALGVEPEEFPEYRLALFRAQFDERAVGLTEALRVMQAYEEEW